MPLRQALGRIFRRPVSHRSLDSHHVPIHRFRTTRACFSSAPEASEPPIHHQTASHTTPRSPLPSALYLCDVCGATDAEQCVFILAMQAYEEKKPHYVPGRVEHEHGARPPRSCPKR